MELRIDDQLCDLGEKQIAVPGYDLSRLTSVEACRQGRSVTITLPPTAHNHHRMNDARDPHTALPFNATPHTAALTAEGVPLITGSVRLLAASDEGYTIEIRDPGAQWAHNAAVRMFSTLGIEYRQSLLPTLIQESWSDPSPVKFFPICRDEYPRQSNGWDLLPAERLLTVDDYHPFLHIETLVRKIFDEAGYRIESQWMESEWFRSLYMSGAYPSRDTTAAANRMGFFARRLGSATASADSFGRVYADPHAIGSNIGNIVDTATPQTLDADGEPIPELMNNGGCFGSEQGRICFRPPTAVSAGFEFLLRYTTDHRILSRTRLAGFDRINLGPGGEMRLELANRYKDYRGELRTNFIYRVVVFDHTAGSQYRLTYTLSDVQGVQWAQFSSRTAQVTTPTDRVTKPTLEIRTGSTWTLFEGDWALYNGYIEEVGKTSVELRVCTASEILSPTTPRYFDQIYFGGAEPGMKLTLDKTCSLRPRFLSTPGYGSVIEFADVARHRIRQGVLLDAIAHLFNLRFYTDAARKVVVIEPADDFSPPTTPVDWSNRTDFSQPVVLEDMAQEVHKRRTWRYAEGDGEAARLESEEGKPLGAWSFDTHSYAAIEGQQELTNPLFRPTLNTTGRYGNAPSAQLMLVGDRDQAQEEATNFTPRIVHYAGLHPLSEGERWGFPSNQAAYPLAAFHFAGDSHTPAFTLCFDDRDGAQGLHRHYDQQAEAEASCQRVTLWLRIAPHEFAALLSPGTGAPDIRSRFRIDTGQGIICATLHRIGEYDPQATSVCCTFTRLKQD